MSTSSCLLPLRASTKLAQVSAVVLYSSMLILIDFGEIAGKGALCHELPHAPSSQPAFKPCRDESETPISSTIQLFVLVRLVSDCETRSPIKSRQPLRSRSLRPPNSWRLNEDIELCSTLLTPGSAGADFEWLCTEGPLPFRANYRRGHCRDVALSFFDQG
ncbi:hypothetical protein VNO77_03090 [Canavalia gladiata]|uniref:Uncharacterized protein n=1 Tax=Canavalia gladiata TaxID=3824 RepID=A0AAN9MW58_CANGL